MEHDIPFGNSNRENGTTFLDFPLFLEIFQWDEPTKRVPFTAEPEIPEILTKRKAPLDPHSLPNQGWENGAFLPFARLHPWCGGDGGLLFHFVLSKILKIVASLGPRDPERFGRAE